MTAFTADWVVPIAGSPIRRGVVRVAEGRIVSVGTDVPEGAVDLGHAAILPALVNAHTHLELSHLRGAVPRADRFTDWVRTMMGTRRTAPDPSSDVAVAAMREALVEMRASGTGLVGDISNSLASVPVLREVGQPAHVFHEILRFNLPDAAPMVADARARVDAATRSGDDVRVSLAPHAPYSVAPSLFRAIRAEVDARADLPTTVHLGESLEEVELLRQGSGPWRQLLQDFGAWTDAWVPPGVSPVAYLESLGFLDARVLVVHGVQFDDADLARLQALGATVATCPRSNRYVGVGDPPIDRFYRSGVAVAFGTDSLASVDDLNLFSELASARRLAPAVPASTLLASATIVGARVLGFGGEFGTIEAGKRAALLAVAVPANVTDVEECLVSGVTPAAVRWLPAA